MRINVAIDGPSGAGKSTISDALAKELNYSHLDTGAMYRVTAYKALFNNLTLTEKDEEKIVELIRNFNLDMKPDGTIICDNEDLTNKIRTNEMSMGASDVSKLPKVREALVEMQQKIAKNKGYILDGRDIGTVVLKDAEAKIYLTASVEERAKRRVLQNQEKGIHSDYEEIKEAIAKRDHQDMTREFSPLKKADDAIEIDSSNMSLDEVVEAVLKIVKQKME